MGDEFLDRFFWRIVSLEFPQFCGHLRAKTISTKIHHHIRAAFGRCLKRVVPQTLWSGSGGQAIIFSNSLRKISLAMGGAKFRWVVSVFSRADGSPCQETLATNRIATTLFLLFLEVLLVHQGYTQVTIIGRWRGPKYFINSSTTELSYSPTTIHCHQPFGCMSGLLQFSNALRVVPKYIFNVFGVHAIVCLFNMMEAELCLSTSLVAAFLFQIASSPCLF